MLNAQQEKLCAENTTHFSDLSAVVINCTLKRSPEVSHTEGLIAVSRAIMEKNGVSVQDNRKMLPEHIALWRHLTVVLDAWTNRKWHCKVC